MVSSIGAVNRAINKVTGSAALRSAGASARVGARRLRTATGGGSGTVASGLGVYGAARAAQNVYEYEKMGNAAQAVGLWTDAQRGALEDYAQQLNQAFPFTNKDILSAAYELSRAGMTFEQVMGSLRSTLNVSLAGDLGLQETADIMTNVAQAMRLPIETAQETADTMKRVGDTLAYAATNSNTDIQQMGTVFKYVAPLAAATGMSLEELAATSMILANNGIKASNAGTGLRFALSSMLKPTKEAMKAFDRLGISVGDYVQGARKISGEDVVQQLAIDGIDAAGLEGRIDAILQDPAIKKAPAKLVAAISQMLSDELGADQIIDQEALASSLSDTLAVLGTQIDFKGLLRALRNNPDAEALLPTIFGKRQAPKVMALLAQDLDATLAKLRDSYVGAADTMSGYRTKGIVGDWMEFVAVVDNLTMTLASSGLLADATQALSALTTAIDKLSDASPALLSIGAKAIAATALLAPLGWIASGVASALSTLATAAGLILSPVGAAAVVLGALAAVFVKNNWEGIKEFGKSFRQSFVDSLTPQTIERWRSIKTAVTDFFKSSDSLKIATETWANWGDAMGIVAAGVADGIEQVISAIENLIAKIRSIGDIKLPSVDGAALNRNYYGSSGTGMANTSGPLNVLGGAESKINGKRASGGPVRRGLTYRVNERGIETVTLGTNAFVGKAGQSGPTVQENHFHINGSDPHAIAEEIGRILDDKLSRSRELSIDGRKTVGGF